MTTTTCKTAHINRFKVTLLEGDQNFYHVQTYIRDFGENEKIFCKQFCVFTLKGLWINANMVWGQTQNIWQGNKVKKTARLGEANRHEIKIFLLRALRLSGFEWILKKSHQAHYFEHFLESFLPRNNPHNDIIIINVIYIPYSSCSTWWITRGRAYALLRLVEKSSSGIPERPVSYLMV